MKTSEVTEHIEYLAESEWHLHEKGKEHHYPKIEPVSDEAFLIVFKDETFRVTVELVSTSPDKEPG